MGKQFTYIAQDVYGNTKDELIFSQVDFTRVLNGASSFTGQIIIEEPLGANNRVTISNLAVGHTVIWVLSDGVPVWGGMLWELDVDLNSRTAVASCRDFFSYYERRILTEDLSYNTDVHTIVGNLITWAGLVGGGNIGTLLAETGSSGNHDVEYLRNELRTIASMILDLSESVDGFDFSIDYSGDLAAGLNHTLTSSSPRRGRNTNLVFDAAKNVRLLQWAQDGWANVNRVHAFNSAGAETKIISTASDVGKLATYPLYERAFSHSDVKEVSVMVDKAAGDLQANLWPVETISLAIDINDSDLSLGTFTVGDIVQVIASHGILDIDGMFRIMEYKVTVNESEAGTVSVTLADARLF